jgi:predicted enzyme related to lactoylglutathione lyase
MLRGLTTINYCAEDLAAASVWYAELLGVEPYFTSPWYVEFRIGDFQHELGILSSEAVAMLGSGRTAGPGGVVTFWHVDDIDAAYARLLELGATAFEPPREFGEGYIAGSVIDPFGNVLGVMYNVHYLGVLDRIPAFELPAVEPATTALTPETLPEGRLPDGAPAESGS